VLAGRWLSTLGALVARAAHEVNNALNGAVVNLEVVRLRSRAGADAGAAASFAGTAAEELERSAALVGALLALTRTPRPGATVADLRDVLHQVVTLLAPAAAQQGVAVVVEPGPDRVGTIAPPIGVRLGITAALLAAADLAARELAVELASDDATVEPARLLRCTVHLDPGPTLRLTGLGDARPALDAVDPDTLVALGAVAIELHADGDALVLRCPTP
jgi:signal transduction histidine kinase